MQLPNVSSSVFFISFSLSVQGRVKGKPTFSWVLYSPWFHSFGVVSPSCFTVPQPTDQVVTTSSATGTLTAILRHLVYTFNLFIYPFSGTCTDSYADAERTLCICSLLMFWGCVHTPLSCPTCMMQDDTSLVLSSLCLVLDMGLVRTTPESHTEQENTRIRTHNCFQGMLSDAQRWAADCFDFPLHNFASNSVTLTLNSERLTPKTHTKECKPPPLSKQDFLA